MKIRMKTAMSGGRSHAPGEIVEIEDKIAKEWIKAGLAEPVVVKKETVRETRKN